MEKRYDRLLQTDGEAKRAPSKSKQYNKTKKEIKYICNMLYKDSYSFKPKPLIEHIERYVLSEDRINRVLYSEISSFIFGIEEWERDEFITNAEKLLEFVLDGNNGVSVNCCDLIIRIYDHAQLAYQQTNNAEKIFAESIEEAKESIRAETKGMEREYITILGIFAAIVLAFVGGITFSSSVLQNIDAVSPYRLALTIILLGAVLINVLFLLIQFILTINDMEYDSPINIKTINIFFGICTALIIIGWVVNIVSLPAAIAGHLPW